MSIFRIERSKITEYGKTEQGKGKVVDFSINTPRLRRKKDSKDRTLYHVAENNKDAEEYEP